MKLRKPDTSAGTLETPKTNPLAKLAPCGDERASTALPRNSFVSLNSPLLLNSAGLNTSHSECLDFCLSSKLCTSVRHRISVKFSCLPLSPAGITVADVQGGCNYKAFTKQPPAKAGGFE